MMNRWLVEICIRTLYMRYVLDVFPLGYLAFLLLSFLRTFSFEAL